MQRDRGFSLDEIIAQPKEGSVLCKESQIHARFEFYGTKIPICITVYCGVVFVLE